jgi:hypothetical protein
MIDTNQIKTVIYNLLSTCGDVYEEDAPEDRDVSFPYITFSVLGQAEVFGRDIMTLRIDVYDTDSDTTAINDIVDEIDNLLNRQKHYQAGLSVCFYRTDISDVTPGQPQLKQRALIYEVRIYFGELIP